MRFVINLIFVHKYGNLSKCEIQIVSEIHSSILRKTPVALYFRGRRYFDRQTEDRQALYPRDEQMGKFEIWQLDHNYQIYRLPDQKTVCNYSSRIYKGWRSSIWRSKYRRPFSVLSNFNFHSSLSLSLRHRINFCLQIRKTRRNTIFEIRNSRFNFSKNSICPRLISWHFQVTLLRSSDLF